MEMLAGMSQAPVPAAARSFRVRSVADLASSWRSDLAPYAIASSCAPSASSKPGTVAAFGDAHVGAPMHAVTTPNRTPRPPGTS